jgi:hypothetical protein
MPRGIKKEVNYTEEIQKVEMRIVHHQNSIKELEEKKETLINQKNEKDMNLLTAYLQQHNLSAGDLLQQLQLNRQTA